MTGALIIPIALQLVAVVVIIAEIIIPSGGILSIIAAGLLGYSLYAVFTEVSNFAGMVFVIADVILLPVVLVIGIKLLARSPATLKTQLSKTDGYSSQSAELSAYAGGTGTAITNLRPSGTALINGRRVDVVSRGEYIEKNTPVTVVAVDGNRVVVKQVQA
jgi:membrane-bound serine protease (ClpP class)